ncbi:hypothetical protein Dxin01_03628 [Deinococcus xinjiangensis]|uniref:Leucine rich repeat variant domain-containing protein n=1 Tax=Deinococcus xinjiangensis TaxID=457454 RepID=A0ABP9VGH4_9DEIO
MAESPLLKEARSPSTDQHRLRLLATAQDQEIRIAALSNPRCPDDVRQLLKMAEERPESLRPSLLEHLARLGPYAVSLAVSHKQIPDTTLIELAFKGHIKLVLEQRKDRNSEWFIKQAERNPALLKYLSENRSVPWYIRKRAWVILQKQPGSNTASVTPPADAGLPPFDPALTQETLREIFAATSPVVPPVEKTEVPATVEETKTKLLQRKTELELSGNESELIANDPKLQRLAARHPYLPVPLLEVLDQQHPYGQARETLLTRLEEHDLEAATFLRLSTEGDWDVRAAMARNPNLPDSVREQLCDDPDWWVRAAVAENPQATPDELVKLARNQEHITIKEHVAAHPHSPGVLLTQLASDGDPAVRAAVARNPSAPPEALLSLASDERFSTREAVAAHALTPEDILVHLASDPNERVAYVARLRHWPLNESRAAEALATRRRQVKLALSSAQQTPPQILQQLAVDRNPMVRAQTALHSHLPEETRTSLSQDASKLVSMIARAADEHTPRDELAFLPRYDARLRQALSRNPQAPEPVLDSLSDDPLLDVRLGVLMNPSSPNSALERRLPEQTLRPVIRRHPRYAGAVQEKLNKIEYREARNENATPEILTSLSLSDSARVRGAVARHAHAPGEVLLVLAGDAEEKVRQAVVDRPSDLGTLGLPLQWQLAQDVSPFIRQKLAERADLVPATMERLIQVSGTDEDILSSVVHHPAVNPEILDQLAQTTSVGVRESVAVHQLTPIPTLMRLAYDSQEEVQVALLRNPQCTAAVLIKLVRHPRLRSRLAKHEQADGAVLEALAFDAGYDRYLKYQTWIERTPFKELKWVKQWQQWIVRRASARAFGELEVLRSVIEHPAVTGKAVRYASRLNHPEIKAALQKRHERLREASRAFSGSPRENS